MDTKTDIDLSWVTFLDKNPKEICTYKDPDCNRDADWFCTAVPCGHTWFFCEEHYALTKHIFAVKPRVACGICDAALVTYTAEPVKRG